MNKRRERIREKLWLILSRSPGCFHWRLTEAKNLLKHGEWGKWLQESVGFSQNRAEKLMRLYKEYGNGLPVRAEPGTQIRELPNLSYTHALILLGVPEEDRAQFISNTDIESMTTRELQRAVDELNQSRQEKENLEKTAATQIKVLTGRVAFRLENLDKAFKELTYELDLLAKVDSGVHGEYKKVLNDFLIKVMQERMRS